MPARKCLPGSQGPWRCGPPKTHHRALGLPGTLTTGVVSAASCSRHVCVPRIRFPESHGPHWPVRENPLRDLPPQFKALTPNIKQQRLLPSRLYPMYKCIGIWYNFNHLIFIEKAYTRYQLKIINLRMDWYFRDSGNKCFNLKWRLS